MLIDAERWGKGREMREMWLAGVEYESKGNRGGCMTEASLLVPWTSVVLAIGTGYGHWDHQRPHHCVLLFWKFHDVTKRI